MLLKKLGNAIVAAGAGGLIAWAGVWVKGVNATQEDVVVLKVVVPRIDQKLDAIDENTRNADQRLSRIEGRVGVQPGHSK